MASRIARAVCLTVLATTLSVSVAAPAIAAAPSSYSQVAHDPVVIDLPDPASNYSKNQLGYTDTNLIPIARWLPGIPKLTARSDAKQIADLHDKITLAISGFSLSMGNMLWELSEKLVTWTSGFSPLKMFGKQLDHVFAALGDVILGRTSAGKVTSPLIVVLIVLTLAMGFWAKMRGKPTEQAFKAFGKLSVVIVAFGVMITGAWATVNGSRGSPTMLAGKTSSFGMFSPGWVIDNLLQLTGIVTNPINEKLSFSSFEVSDAAQNDYMHCDHYVKALHDLAGNVSVGGVSGNQKLSGTALAQLSNTWQHSGMQMWKDYQFGNGRFTSDDTLIADYVWCHMAEVKSGVSIADQKAVWKQIGVNVFDDVDELNPPLGMHPASGAIGETRAGIAYAACGFDGHSFFARPDFKAGTNPGDLDITDADCEFFWTGSKGVLTQNRDDLKDAARKFLPFNSDEADDGSFNIHEKDQDFEKALGYGGAMDFVAHLYGSTSATGITPAVGFGYAICGVMVLIAFGVISLIVIFAGFMMLLSILTLAVVLLATMLPFALGTQTLKRWFTQLFGAVLVHSMYGLLLGLVGFLATMITSIATNDQTKGSLGTGVILFIALGPLLSLLVLKFLLGRLFKTNPLSLSGIKQNLSSTGQEMMGHQGRRLSHMARNYMFRKANPMWRKDEAAQAGGKRGSNHDPIYSTGVRTDAVNPDNVKSGKLPRNYEPAPVNTGTTPISTLQMEMMDRNSVQPSIPTVDNPTAPHEFVEQAEPRGEDVDNVASAQTSLPVDILPVQPVAEQHEGVEPSLPPAVSYTPPTRPDLLNPDLVRSAAATSTFGESVADEMVDRFKYRQLTDDRRKTRRDKIKDWFTKHQDENQDEISRRDRQHNLAFWANNFDEDAKGELQKEGRKDWRRNRDQLRKLEGQSLGERLKAGVYDRSGIGDALGLNAALADEGHYRTLATVHDRYQARKARRRIEHQNETLGGRAKRYLKNAAKLGGLGIATIATGGLALPAVLAFKAVRRSTEGASDVFAAHQDKVNHRGKFRVQVAPEPKVDVLAPSFAESQVASEFIGGVGQFAPSTLESNNRKRMANEEMSKAVKEFNATPQGARLWEARVKADPRHKVDATKNWQQRFATSEVGATALTSMARSVRDNAVGDAISAYNAGGGATLAAQLDQIRSSNTAFATDPTYNDLATQYEQGYDAWLGSDQGASHRQNIETAEARYEKTVVSGFASTPSKVEKPGTKQHAQQTLTQAENRAAAAFESTPQGHEANLAVSKAEMSAQVRGVDKEIDPGVVDANNAKDDLMEKFGQSEKGTSYQEDIDSARTNLENLGGHPNKGVTPETKRVTGKPMKTELKQPTTVPPAPVLPKQESDPTPTKQAVIPPVPILPKQVPPVPALAPQVPTRPATPQPTAPVHQPRPQAAIPPRLDRPTETERLEFNRRPNMDTAREVASIFDQPPPEEPKRRR
jgi:hypothetical protein